MSGFCLVPVSLLYPYIFGEDFLLQLHLPERNSYCNMWKKNIYQILVLMITIIIAIVVFTFFNGKIKTIDEKLHKAVPANDTLTIKTIK